MNIPSEHLQSNVKDEVLKDLYFEALYIPSNPPLLPRFYTEATIILLVYPLL